MHQSTPGAFEKDGQFYKNVEDVRAKDLVLSWNEKTDKFEYKPVVQNFIRQTDKIYQLTYEDGTVIETTWSHPFYIEGKGWVKAEKLRAGDVSKTDKGTLRITKVHMDPRSEEVYNFEVAENHTYLVTDKGVVVHNAEKYSLTEHKAMEYLQEKYSIDPATIAEQEFGPLILKSLSLLGVSPSVCRYSMKECVAAIETTLSLKDIEMNADLAEKHPTSALGMELARSEKEATAKKLQAQMNVLRKSIDAREAYINSFSDAEWKAMQDSVIAASGCENNDSCSPLVERNKNILRQSTLYLKERNRLKQLTRQYGNAMTYLSQAQAEFQQGHYYKGQVALNNAESYVVRRNQFNNERAAIHAMYAQTTMSDIADFASIYPGAGANSPLSGVYVGGGYVFPSTQRMLQALPPDLRHNWEQLIKFPYLPQKVRANISVVAYRYYRNQRQELNECVTTELLPPGNPEPRVVECY